MNALIQTGNPIGAKESAWEYIRKTLKITGYALSVNKVFIVLMLVVCFLTVIICDGNVTGGREEDSYIIISAALGFFMPLIMFQHMFRRGEYDFYAAMPIKKSRYFWGFTIAAVAAFLMIYIVVTSVNGIITGLPDHKCGCFFSGLALFFSVFCATMLAIMLSKSLFAFFVAFIIINGFVIETFEVLWHFLEVNFNTYFSATQGIISFFTPFIAAQLFYPENQYWAMGFLPLIMAAAELAAAFFLHRIRNNDGRSPLAFSKTRYPIQYLIMFMAAFFANANHISARNRIRDFTEFCNKVFRGDIILNTLIIILITFILTNMIFENSPRGVFRKIRHLFIFTGMYGIIYFLIIGGLLYPNLPQNFVPFKSNAAVIYVYNYEERSEEEYNASRNAYDKAWEDVYNCDTSDADYERLHEIAVEVGENHSRWQIAYVDESISEQRYLRATDVTAYFVTNGEYIDYLSQKVKESSPIHIYSINEQGYNGILSDYEDFDESANSYGYNKTKIENTRIVDIVFYDMYNDATEEDINNWIQNGKYLHERSVSKHGYGVTTFTEKDEDIEQIKANSAKSVVKEYFEGHSYGYYQSCLF